MEVWADKLFTESKCRLLGTEIWSNETVMRWVQTNSLQCQSAAYLGAEILVSLEWMMRVRSLVIQAGWAQFSTCGTGNMEFILHYTQKDQWYWIKLLMDFSQQNRANTFDKTLNASCDRGIICYQRSMDCNSQVKKFCLDDKLNFQKFKSTRQFITLIDVINLF